MATFSNLTSRLLGGSLLLVRTQALQQPSAATKVQPCLLKLLRCTSAGTTCTVSPLHTSASMAHFRNTDFEDKAPTKVGKVNLKAPNWLKYNEVVYAPTEPGQPERPAEICHSRFQIKYAPKKLWYLAVMIRGMSIDEAFKQMTFNKKLGAAHIKEVLEEAQELAVNEHIVEFKSNLWICDSFVTKGIKMKGYRRHARGRYGSVDYRYANYYVRLREGRPPKQYYPSHKSGNEKLKEYLEEQRNRKIKLGL